MKQTCAALLALLLVPAAEPTVARAAAGGAAAQDPAQAVAVVRSKDGTKIAYERSGRGPVLVLVGAALSDRADFARLAALLEDDFTVVRYDRRGRGASGDTPPYDVRREVEDVEALIDACGGSAFVFGGSSGAVLAFEAADRLADKVAGAVLFEPPFVVDDSRAPIADDLFERIGALVRDGSRGDAVALFLTEGIGVPSEAVAGMRAMPMWPKMERLAHTLPYDGALLAGLQQGKPLPTARWTSRKARTLVLDGERSDAFLRSSARALADLLPGAERRTLAGLDHSAMFLAPQAIAEAITAFLAPRAPDAEGAARGAR